MFATDDPAIQETLAIQALPDGDTGFRWLQVVIAARKITESSSSAGPLATAAAHQSKVSG